MTPPPTVPILLLHPSSHLYVAPTGGHPLFAAALIVGLGLWLYRCAYLWARVRTRKTPAPAVSRDGGQRGFSAVSG